MTGIDWMSWLELALRWFHVIAGIAWIGSSFYFIWLDNSLRRADSAPEGVAGELWAVHGGGFYHKQKYMVAPENLPAELHWFKYEAYFTWISGFLLLGVLYYLGAELYLIDPAKADLSAAGASAIGIGVLVGGWLVYDGLCRSPLRRSDLGLGIVWFALLTAAAWGLLAIFSGRGAAIHLGALIGTAMAANVFFVIIPNQKKVVAAMRAGREVDPALGRAAKQRSLHNNYMTLPVLFLMVSNHYPATFSGPFAWATLAGISLSGILIRHFFNLRHTGRTQIGYVAAGIAVFLLTIVVSAELRERGRSTSGAGQGDVSFAEVRGIIERHCVSCHAADPTHPAFGEAPMGVRLDSDGAIRRHAARIHAQAVESRAMPLGNASGMREDERAQLDRWFSERDSRGPSDGE